MKVTYGQGGYVGSSMSVRAAQAYEDGEMPKSKWTKRAMVAAIRDAAYDEGLVVDLAALAKMKKEDVFSSFFYNSSWHHTSKFANPTDFFSVDEDALRESLLTAPMPESMARMRVACEAVRALELENRMAESLARAEAGRVERAREKRADDAFLAEHPAEVEAVKAMTIMSPDARCFRRSQALDETLSPNDYTLRVSKAGNVLISHKGGREMLLREWLSRAPWITVSGHWG